MNTEAFDDELHALKQRALVGDIGGMRDTYQRGELQWLRDHMPVERYAHLGVSLERNDPESVRSDLATVQSPVKVVTLPTVDPNEVRRLQLLQSQRNGLIAVAIVGALAVLGLIGFLVFRNNDNSTDTTVPVVVVSDTVSDTSNSDASTPSTITPALTVVPSVPEASSPDVLVPPSTVPSATVSATQAAAAATQPTQATAPITVQSVTTPAPSSAPPVTAAGARKSDFYSAAERSATFGNFLALVDAAGLREEIQGLNPSTVLAPTENAFSSLPVEVQAGLKSPANKAILSRIVRYNVIPQAISLSQFTTAELKTLEGSTLSVVVGNNKVVINDATVTGADVLTITGVLHAIDKLLVPPGVSLNALAPKAVPSATAPPQTNPPSTQPLATIVSATQPIATTPPPPAATQVQPAATTSLAPTTTKVI